MIAGAVQDIPYAVNIKASNKLRVVGFPWGFDVVHLSRIKQDDDYITLAVIHKYCWFGSFSHPGAKKEDNLSSYKDRLKGYDVAVFGDNHRGFKGGIITEGNGKSTTVFNCGSLMRRRMDQRDYKPMVGLLHSNGYVEKHFLDTAHERFVNFDAVVDILKTNNLIKKGNADINMETLMDELQQGVDLGQGFIEAVNMYLATQDIPLGTRQMVMECLGRSNNV